MTGWAALIALGWVAVGARVEGPEDLPSAAAGEGSPTTPPLWKTDPAYREERRRMVELQIRRRGVVSPAVLEAMGTVPRHRFVPEGLADRAYDDTPLPIGEGQTISQPYVVAWMTETLGLKPGERVLEIGTGSGYQTAVLAALGVEVYTVELSASLSLQARRRLEDLGFQGVRFRVGDGSAGWPEEAPFDAVLAACAIERIPRRLVDQLAPGGRLIFPLGPEGDRQDLTLVERGPHRLRIERLGPVVFVPMKGGALEPEEP